MDTIQNDKYFSLYEVSWQKPAIMITLMTELNIMHQIRKRKIENIEAIIVETDGGG